MAGDGGAPAFDALVLDLDTRGSLAIARALGRAGLRVAVGAQQAAAPGLATRYAAARTSFPRAEDGFDAYADAIVEFVRRRPAGAILCTIDASVMALHRRRVELSPYAVPAVGAVEAVEIAVSKPRTLAVAAELGIVSPRSIYAQAGDDVEAAARELGLPVVVKPEESWRDEGTGGTRLYPQYADGDRALAAARELAPALVQEVVPGVRETIKLFRVGGEVVARFAMRIDRTWPPLGGSSVLRESVEPPADALEQAERLVEAIGLDGYSEVEFRRDPAGRPVLMEVNPRLSQSAELAVRAGVDFPRMQLEWARGREVRPVGRYRIGVRLGWLGGDARLAVAALRGGGPPPRPSTPPLVRDYVLRRSRIEGLDLDDPRPILGSLAFAARALRRR